MFTCILCTSIWSLLWRNVKIKRPTYTHFFVKIYFVYDHNLWSSSQLEHLWWKSHTFFFQRHVKGFAWGDECKMLVIWHIEDQQWIESLLCSFVSTKCTVVVNFYDKQDTLRQEVQLDWFSEGKHPSNRSIWWTFTDTASYSAREQFTGTILLF